MRKFRIWLSLFGLAAQILVDLPPAHAATYHFGNNVNGLTGLSSKTLTVDLSQLALSVHDPAGATFVESDPAGLTIDSTGLPGFVDSEGPGKINRISGPGLATDAAEAVNFSFDGAGILTGINFDGVKDESLEYFILTSAGGLRVNFFDSAANLSSPGAVDAALTAGAVTGSVVYLQENSLIDDEALNLHIPFAAGQEFVIAYGELGAEFGATEAGNGARLQGLTARFVPEPHTFCLILAGGGIITLQRRQRRQCDRRRSPAASCRICH